MGCRKEPSGLAEPPDGRGEEGYLVALLRRGEVVSLLRPRGNGVSVGRSSRCQLRSDDPAFPRRAGELILHPLPLFRPTAGKEGHRGTLHKLSPGQRLHLGTHCLVLLPPGGMLRNRQPLAGSWKAAFLALFLLLLAAPAILPPPRQAVPPPPQNSGRTVTVPCRFSLPSPSTDEARAAAAGMTAEEQGKHPGEEAKAGSGEPTGMAPPSPPENMPSRLSGEGQGGIAPRLLERLLSRARDRMLAGDPQAAGRYLVEVLDLASARQREQIVESLEDAAARCYRRAYMIMPYRREEARAELEQLAGCGLELLPSVRKAGMLLKAGERTHPRSVAAVEER